MKIFDDVPDVFLHRDVVDFRKPINGLVGIVEDELEYDANNGALFVFCNKVRDKLKVIYWGKTGFALWYKRLGRKAWMKNTKYGKKSKNPYSIK
jgi:transposase